MAGKQTTFDFRDGEGPVPAHQHSNGGGWVADTAVVSKTVYVDMDARVYDNASVRGWVSLHDSVRVHGMACLDGAMNIYDEVGVSGEVKMIGGDELSLEGDLKISATPVIITELLPWPIVFVREPRRMVAIGCNTLSPEEWRKRAAQLARDAHAPHGSVRKLMQLLDLVYGKPPKHKR